MVGTLHLYIATHSSDWIKGVDISVGRGGLDGWQGRVQNIILYSGPGLTTEQFQRDWCGVDGVQNS